MINCRDSILPQLLYSSSFFLLIRPYQYTLSIRLASTIINKRRKVYWCSLRTAAMNFPTSTNFVYHPSLHETLSIKFLNLSKFIAKYEQWRSENTELIFPGWNSKAIKTEFFWVCIGFGKSERRGRTFIAILVKKKYNYWKIVKMLLLV